MNKHIRIRGQRRAQVDLELLARALLELVDELDIKTRSQLAREGARLSEELLLEPEVKRARRESAA